MALPILSFSLENWKSIKTNIIEYYDYFNYCIETNQSQIDERNFKAYNLYLQSDHRFLIDKIHVISLESNFRFFKRIFHFSRIRLCEIMRKNRSFSRQREYEVKRSRTGCSTFPRWHGGSRFRWRIARGNEEEWWVALEELSFLQS